MFNTLKALIEAKYYKDGESAMLIVNTLFTGQAVTEEEYAQLAILVSDNYPSPAEEEQSRRSLPRIARLNHSLFAGKVNP